MKKILVLGVVLLILLAGPTESIFVRGAPLNFSKAPKVANLFFRWDITEAEAEQLAKWDILIIDMEVQHYSPDSLRKIKKHNPNIKLLAYLASQEVRGDSCELDGTLRKILCKQIAPQWWLRDTDGNQVAWWPTNPIINVSPISPTSNGKRFYDIYPWFIKNELMATGLWDGVFFDNTWEDISFLHDFKIDLNQDGVQESRQDLINYWRMGMNTLLSNTRNVLGSEYLIVSNGGEGYYKYINGTFYEHFPYQGWSNTMNKYRFISENGQTPAIGVINTNVNNSGNRFDYQRMRFGLASALMGDGFYSFDNGDLSHAEIWWYDEYNAYLGHPISAPTNLFGSSKNLEVGLWRRDFEKGIAIVNSTPQVHTVNLNAEFEKLHGTQVPEVNNGAIVSKVTLQPYDGILLTKSVSHGNIEGSAFVNGSFARVFDNWGKTRQTGFFTYQTPYQGGSQILRQDINKDGRLETLVADHSSVTIYDHQGKKIRQFYPYEKSYNRGINIAVGDLDHNDTFEIITGTENGGGPQVRIFNHQGDLINPGFFAYDQSFRGGVNIAVGDLDGNGTAEIIAGAGYGGGPHVRIFNKDGKLINPGFFAYNPNFRGGVNVAVGDVNGDGFDDIITGPGKGGGPHIRVFDQDGRQRFAQFFAFDKSLNSGVEVIASDVDGDGLDEIIATSSDVFNFASF